MCITVLSAFLLIGQAECDHENESRLQHDKHGVQISATNFISKYVINNIANEGKIEKEREREREREREPGEQHSEVGTKQSKATTGMQMRKLGMTQ